MLIVPVDCIPLPGCRGLFSHLAVDLHHNDVIIHFFHFSAITALEDFQYRVLYGFGKYHGTLTNQQRQFMCGLGGTSSIE